MVLVIGVCSRARADSIYLGGWSVHAESAHATNATHHFFVLEHNNFIAGTFVNSYGDRTEVIGRRYPIDLLPDSYFKFAIAPTITHGYYTCYGERAGTHQKNCLMPVVEAQYTKYDVAPTLLLIDKGAVLMVNVKF